MRARPDWPPWNKSIQVDPSLERLFLCEALLSGLPVLARPDVAAVTLRTASLSWEPDPAQLLWRDPPSLAVLESGSCFLAADTNKILIATFSRPHVQPIQITMEPQGQPNLLEYLRAESFTLEISGTNRRRPTRQLTFSALLEFNVGFLPGT